MRTDIADKFFPAAGGPWSVTEWRLPFVLALIVHVMALLLLIVSPFLQSSKPVLNVQTVNLFNASEIKPAPAPRISKPAPPPPPAPVSKKTAPPPVSTAPKPTATKPPVSLRPLKKKLKAEDTDRKVKQAILERKLRQVRAGIEKERAEQMVKKEVNTALERIRQSYAATGFDPSAATKTATPATTPTATVGSGKSGIGQSGSGTADVSEAKKRYYAAIVTQLSQYWTLPESHDWKESLEVIAVLWFRRDGTIVKRAYERQSENDYFNRFVRLTLEKVDKVPPIPLDLPSQEADQIIRDGLGFRFHPSGIY